VVLYPFPARTVVSSFEAAETSLAKVLEIVPYCAEHRKVWSPLLATILIDTCSQLDSLWRHVACVRGKKPATLTMSDYRARFGPSGADRLNTRFVVFWGDDQGLAVAPFREWGTKQTLGWWTAYNAVKHDRLRNRTEATIQNATYALAGLFIAILHAKSCLDGILHTSWVPGLAKHPGLLRDSLTRNATWAGLAESNLLIPESRLFSCAPNATTDSVRGQGSCESSPRFYRWWTKSPDKIEDLCE
jgi:hypothetical protein